MIWRIILLWLLAVPLALANLPQHSLLPVQERDINNNVLNTYTRGLDLSQSLAGAGGIGGLLARTATNGSTYYHSDGEGNVTALIDGYQVIQARYLYDPFGRLIGQWGGLAGANEMQFSSMPHHGNSGLNLYAFRVYDPTLSRWLNQDPIGENGGINLYGFNLNNAVNTIDPFGLTTYVSDTPFSFDQGRTDGPYTYSIDDGNDAVLPSVPYLTDREGLESDDMTFAPVFLPEIPAVSRLLDAAGDLLGSAAKRALKKMGVEKPKLPKCPAEPYNRLKHYGKTPTAADRKALGAGPGEVVDHDPSLVKRYYEGDPAAGEKPGFQQTPEERAAGAADRDRMQTQSQADSNQQGGQMSNYSKTQKQRFWP